MQSKNKYKVAFQCGKCVRKYTGTLTVRDAV